ncbi:MAG: bifunctional (p)ppGpp synthetase/guanosine-3',5'-bis(diphosphate) 3'-pyrophosphohydrolase [Zetaproteobacteria bacterium]|nr:MAG: bifunctional (p)ppGpp synthetase/guanosine-3',5'-bis(diphosphate) 3'-pyrophosphohydrolase [Zetaproteobacteria bacterium]
MTSIAEIVGRVAAYAPKSDLDRIRRAYVFAANMHEGQKRRSGEPYIAHPLAVAEIVAQLRMDEPSVSAALLHDTVEDTPATLEEVRSRFGEEIAALVDGVTKVGRIRFRSHLHKQAENFRKMMLATARDLRVLIIKLADRLHNMRTIRYLPEEKRRAIADETMQIYAPLAHRMGLYGIKQELEDLAFAELDPESYAEITQRLSERMPKLDPLRARIERVLLEALTQAGIRAEVTSRIKNAFSIYQKMQKKHVDFDEIIDLVAFRILVDEPLDCYRALGVVHGLYRPIPGRFKDYIALPKPNGYQSLHTAVIGPDGYRIEIQIRTHAMHRLAEEGVAAHWSYKEGTRPTAEFQWLRRMLDLMQQSEQPEEALEHARLDLWMSEVYVFSRDGDIFALPRGATALDFAYAVHTDVGHHCVAVRINGEEAPLDQVLRNGDQVEVITDPDQTPSRQWLRFVHTARARQAIRQWFRRQEREAAMRLGRALLEQAFGSAQLPQEVLAELGAKDLEEAWMRIGCGEIPWTALAKALGEEGTPVVAGQDEAMLLYPAPCCRPIPGDPVIGRLVPGRVEVHHRRCPEAVAGEDWVEVRWQPHPGRNYPAGLWVLAHNVRGMLARLSQTIADAGLSIEDLQIRQRPGQLTELWFVVLVASRDELARLIRRLRRLEGVVRVGRAHHHPNKEAK